MADAPTVGKAASTAKPKKKTGEESGRPRWPAYSLKAAVAAAILFFLFRRIPPGQVGEALLAAELVPLLGAVGLGAAGQLGVAYRLRLLARAHGLEFSTLQMLGINLSALFYSLFIPGGNVTAGAVRLYKMTRGEGRLAEAFSAILRDRLDATVALAVVGLGFLWIDRPDTAPVARFALAFGLASCLFLWLLLFHPAVARWTGSWVDRLPIPFVRTRLSRLWEELEVAGQIGAGLQARVFSISVAVHATGVGAYLLLARALAIDVGAAALGWIRSAVIFITMIPVSLGGIGLREGAFLVFLGPYGVAEERALALSFLVFAATVVLFGAAGGLLEARGLWGTGRASETTGAGRAGRRAPKAGHAGRRAPESEESLSRTPGTEAGLSRSPDRGGERRP